MSDYWVNFARSGNPNGQGLPTWQKYTESSPDYVELNGGVRPDSDITPEAWKVFDKVMAARRQ